MFDAKYVCSLNSAMVTVTMGNELCGNRHLFRVLNGVNYNFVFLQVHFLKEGCGDDNICNSNLKLEYKFCTREGNQDKFSYLPM